MNKKTKWAIPFAVLALTCGIAAGCTGGGDEHEHSYTEWAYNETQHWKECPEDHVKDEETIADHVFVDGTCEVCGATQQTQPVTDLTITNGTTDTNGTVTLSKTTAKAGDSVTITVTPNESYQLKSLTVNGANVFGAMTGNTYEFTVSENTTVIAAFEKIASSSVNAQITGKKYGVTGNSLAAGTTVTLSAENREDITATIKEDGTIRVAEIAGDNWKIKVDGYIAAEIIIPRDAEYTTAISLEYDLMENLKNTWGNSDSVDLSSQNDGKIVHQSGYVEWVSTKESYGSVAITAKVVKSGFRQGVFIRFAGDTYDNDKYVMVSKENNEKIGWCAMDGGSDYRGGPLSPWEDSIKPLAKDEYELTLVRDGADIYFFVDGEFISKKTFADYADKECYVGLFCTDATTMENSERTFAIEDASAFLDVNVTDETAEGEHGTVTIDKTTAKLNDTVTVTLAPENGYKIKDLKIDDISVLAQINNNAYTFTALKNATVVAEFEEAKTVDSVELTVTAANGFTADGTEITLEQLGTKWTGTVQSGKVTLGNADNPVAIGTLNVTANFGGYQIKLGTVEITLPSEGTMATAQTTLGFTGSGIETDCITAANPATGELTYKLAKNDGGAYNNKYDIAEIDGGGYFAFKVKFNQDQTTLTLILRDGNGNEIKQVVQNNNSNGKGTGWGFDGANNGIWGDPWFDLSSYNDILKTDGLWLVLHYDAATGEAVTYIGTSISSMRPAMTLKNFGAGIKLNGVGVGNWFGGHTASDTANVTLKYGATMADIGMSIEDKVTVTASVDDEETGSVTLDVADGKYFSNTQVKVTVTASAGYYLKSIKVGDTVIETGWATNGNVYTYTFTAPEGGATVVATLAESPEVTLSNITVNITDGTNKIDLGDTVAAKLTPSVGDAYDVTLTKGADGAYTFGGTFLKGEYNMSLVGKNLGYSSVDVAINEDTAAVSVQYVLATATKYHHGDNNGMGECDFETLIAIDANTVNINTANANGKTVDGFWCWGSPVPEATLNISDEVKNATNVTLEFNLKATSPNDQPNNAFGIVMTEGYKGVNMSFWNTTNDVDGVICRALQGCMLGNNEFSDDKNNTNDWIEVAMYGNTGVNIRVVREGATITFYAQNTAITDGDQWVKIFETTCDESAKADIKFLGMGSDYTVSAITVTINETNSVA